MLGCEVCGGTLANAGGDLDAANLGEHVLEGRRGLGAIPGLLVAAGGPGGDHALYQVMIRVDEQGEQDGALESRGLVGLGRVSKVS